jgi:hypothetical protein
LDEEEINPSRTLLSMVLEMQNKFEKYWDISYLTKCIPVILDPRFKFGFVEFCLKKVYGANAGDHIAKVDKMDTLLRWETPPVLLLKERHQQQEKVIPGPIGFDTSPPEIIKHFVSSTSIYRMIYFHWRMRASIF